MGHPVFRLQGHFGYLYEEMERAVAKRPDLTLRRIRDDNMMLWDAYGVHEFPAFLARLDGVAVAELYRTHFYPGFLGEWLDNLLGPESPPQTL